MPLSANVLSAACRCFQRSRDAAGASSLPGLSLGAAPGRFGFEAYTLVLDVAGERHRVEAWTIAEESSEGGLLNGHAGPLRAIARIRRVPRTGAFTVDVTLENRAGKPVTFTGAAFGQFGAAAKFNPGPSHVLGWALRYAHTGNLRTERYPLCAADYPYVRQLPVETRTLGDTEDQPFPALFIKNDTTNEGLVIGMATQEKAAPVFTLQRKPLFQPDAFAQFVVRWDYPQSRGFLLAPGDTFVLETLYLQAFTGREADTAFDDFLAHVSATHAFRGKSSPFNEAALHCTWNYGVFADQREATLAETAQFIARELPQIRYFLIDDGYLRHEAAHSRVFLNRFYPDPAAAPVDPTSWPKGIRGFTAQLKAQGLRPGLWWTPTVSLPCRMHDEHPDWFLRRADGSLYLISGKYAYLDYSHPDALAFLDRTLAVILGEWGMEACKIDFWSQNFETRDALLTEPNCSSLEIRRRFFATVRRHLPADGVIMSCIAMGMGNPFLAEFVETFRCSMDISDGTWVDQVNNCLWTLPILGFSGRQTFLLNTDSVGINPALPANENFFRLTWCYITMGLIETGGRLERLEEPYRGAFQKLLARCDRGHPCRCPDRRAYTGDPLPTVVYVDFPADSATSRAGVRQSVAFFNWTDRPALLAVDRRELRQPGRARATDFWTDESTEWTDDFATVTLAPRSARLFDVTWP